MATVIKHGERVSWPEARVASAAGGACACGAARARAGRPHARWRRTSRLHAARRAAWTQACDKNHDSDALLQF